MFHKATTEEKRKDILKDYKLRLLKKQQNLETKKRLAKQTPAYDQDILFEKPKENIFGSFVDFVVVKGFIIDQIKDRLKLNKSSVSSFVNNLNKDEIYILSKHLQDFIKFTQTTNPHAINDYILKSAFTTFKLQYEAQEKQKKDSQLLNSVFEETKEAIETNTQTQVSPSEVQDALEDDEEEEATAMTTPIGGEVVTSEIQKLKLFFIDVEKNLSGSNSNPKNKQLKSALENIGMTRAFDDLYLPSPKKLSFSTLVSVSIEYMKGKMEMEKKAQDVRELNEKFMSQLVTELSLRTNLLEKGAKTPARRRLEDDLTAKPSSTGKGMMKGKGMTLFNEKRAEEEDYLRLGKYKIKKSRFIGSGTLIARTMRGLSQVPSIKSKSVSKPVKKVLLKVINNETISYNDVSELTENDQDDLYNIARQFHVTDLFDIPSRLKNADEKLIEEYTLLRGSIINGNDNPETIKKFKVALLKLRQRKMISVAEYNELTTIMLQLGY